MLRTLAVFAGSLGYFLLFRHYGFQVEDEGTLLFQLRRVADGQLPYVDFHTGYTPGFFVVGALALELLGGSTEGVRAFLAVLNATSAAALYGLASTVVGPWMALVPPLVWVAFLPVFPGDFASFNVPYPAWFATLALLGTAVALLRWARTPRRGWALAAGVCAALAFAVKPNAGAFALAASVWVIGLAARQRSGLERAVVAVASVTMALGIWLAFGFAWWSIDAAVHLLPVLAISVLVAGPFAGRWATDHAPPALEALGMLALGFALPTLSWLVPTLARLGIGSFLRDVLLLGSGAAELYHLHHPPPELYALAVVGGALALALGGALVRRGAARPFPLVVIGAIAAGGLALRVLERGLMPESVGRSVVWQLENAGYWLAPVAHWGGIAVLTMGAAARGGPVPPIVLLTPLAIAMYLQLYPRTDSAHLLMSMPLTLVLAVALLGRVLAWWERGRWPGRMDGRVVVRATLAGATVAAVVAAASPALHGWWMSDPQAPPVVATPTLVASVEPAVADDLRAFARTVEFLEGHTDPADSVLAFPALTGLLFAARRGSPVPHDYWYPGRPDHTDESHMLAQLEKHPPRFIVTLNTGWTFFIDAPEYFLATRDFVAARYRLAARFGRYDVLARRDVALPEAPVVWQPTGPAEAVIEPDLVRRRQAARRWMAALTPAEAHAATLPSTSRDAILLLRGIRDGGDVRAAGWLLAGHASGDARVRREALGAMFMVTDRLEAGRSRWANDFDPAAHWSYVAPYAPQARALSAAPDDRARAFGAALLSLAPLDD